MGNRPTLTLKSKRATVAECDNDLADLLDQPSRIDPFHPHMATKPSVDAIADHDRICAILDRFRERAIGDRSMSPRAADAAIGEASQLMRKLANAASDKGKDK
jgi:hypothetical protein